MLPMVVRVRADQQKQQTYWVTRSGAPCILWNKVITQKQQSPGLRICFLLFCSFALCSFALRSFALCSFALRSFAQVALLKRAKEANRSFPLRSFALFSFALCSFALCSFALRSCALVALLKRAKGANPTCRSLLKERLERLERFTLVALYKKE